MAAAILNEVAVNVTWIQLSSSDVSNYIVYFSQFGRTLRKRQVMSSGKVMFPPDTSWGIVRDLKGGVEYQFQVVAVVEVSGVEREGERSRVSDDSTATLEKNGGGIMADTYPLV